MTRLRRSFTAEFKLDAASLVLDQGYSVPEASRTLDVGETVLHHLLVKHLRRSHSHASWETPYPLGREGDHQYSERH